MHTCFQDYYELMELAEKGNNLNVDMSEQDAMATTEDSKDSSGAGVYSDWKEDLSADRPVFLWGKAVGKKLCEYKNRKPSSSVNRKLLGPIYWRIYIDKFWIRLPSNVSK